MATKERRVTTKELLLMAEERGFRMTRKRPGEAARLVKIPHRFDGKGVEIGIVSDTQFCSKYQQLSFLHEAYDLFASRGITDVLHAGDILDGQWMYRGHQYETIYSGADAQRDYAVTNYPKREGITTWLVGGNHDFSHIKISGHDALAAIGQKREDIRFLGYFAAMVEIGGVKLRLQHPRGGVPYARSYRLQKIVEQLSPQEKPDAIFVGHLHIGAYLPQYRNVESFQVPCFQAQTPYLAELGLHPTIGFLILRFLVNDVERKTGLVKTVHEWHHLFVPKTNDY